MTNPTTPSGADAVRVTRATVYVLNADNTNRWSANVQPGNDDDGKRVTDEECCAIASKIAEALLASQATTPSGVAEPADERAYQAHIRKTMPPMGDEGRSRWHFSAGYTAALAASQAASHSAEPACKTCNDHGMIGGLLPAGGGYDGKPCPDCAPAEPVGWVSPEQLAAHEDGGSDGSGRYLPVRKTMAGKFTMPIYGAATVGAPAEPVANGESNKYIALAEKCSAEVGRYEGQVVWVKFHSLASVEAFATGIVLSAALKAYAPPAPVGAETVAMRAALDEVIGCFGAAAAEGLAEALAETTDERLKDLVERRLMYAFAAAFASPAQAPAAPTIETVRTLMQSITHSDRHGDLWSASTVDERAIALKVLRAFVDATPVLPVPASLSQQQSESVFVPASPAWIDVKDRMPTHLYSVLGVVTDGPFVVQGDPEDRMRDVVSYSPERGVWLQHDGNDSVVVTVTHWQEMGDLP